MSGRGRRLLALSASSLATLSALWVGDKWQYTSGKERREFQIQSTETTIMASLNSGDLVLIDRPVRQFSPFKLLAVVLSKSLSRSGFDHVGVIIRDEHEDVPYVLEHGFHGPTLTPFEDRYSLCTLFCGVACACACVSVCADCMHVC